MEANIYHDHEYLNLVRYILKSGIQKGDRTGTGTISVFAPQMRFNLMNGSIPLLTTKKMFTRGIIHEMIWFLAGDTNIKYLNDNKVHIWDEWADENGNLGPIYGAQWRNWGGHTEVEQLSEITTSINKVPGVDQIAQVIDQLRNNPDDRRIIVSAWNVGEIENMALPPCHALFQFWSAPLEGFNKRQLKCHLYQRSCDVGLGVPFNVVQYSILAHMIAHITDHIATEFVWTGGDTHIYNNHIDKLTEQVSRKPVYPSPRLALNENVKEIDDFKYEDFQIVGYDKYHDTIKMEVSV